MKTHRRKFTSKFKAKVVLEAIAEKDSLSDLALKFDLNKNQISDWKKKFLANAHFIFDLDENGLLPASSHENGRIENTSEQIYSPFMPLDKNLF